MKATHYWHVCSALLLATLGMTLPTNAQVVPDGTLSTTVSQSGSNFTITNGNQVGNNLFHSFSQFSIPIGGSAFFNNASTIQNIFARVTGGSASNLDGLIRANGSANLFLLNPAGILFGANAQLNIGGSFVGTTASSVKFADGTEFSAVNPTPALLTMSVPIGLQMGQNPGAITVQGTGHQLTQPSFFYPILPLSPAAGLGVNSGQTLALVGGAIDLAGGVLTAPSGHVELGSVRAGTIGLNTAGSRWQFDYVNARQFGDIRLTQQALVNGSGAPAGSIRLQGQNISLLEGSVARLQNLGGAALGDLVVNASGLLALRQVGTRGFQNSLLSTENLGTGAGSNLNITAQRLSVQDGGVITTKTFSSGMGGNMTLNVADTADVDGWSSIDASVTSAIGAATLSSGHGGDLKLSTRQLKLTNGGNILNLTAGSGLVGNLTVVASDQVTVMGENTIISRTSAIATTTLFQGNGGDVSVTTPVLLLREGGGIGSTTLGAGNGGNLTIDAAKRIEVTGTASVSMQPSRIVAKAELLPAVQRQAYGLPPFPTGNAGNLTLTTPLLQVNDRALVGVDNGGIGNAGNLYITSDRVLLDRQGSITAATQVGGGGNIALNLQAFLLLRHQSTITSTSTSQGDGGNITINAPIILGLENSDIIANAVQGRGGNIQITTQGIVGLKYRAQLTPKNDITASSQFGVNGTVQINNIGVDPNSGLVTLPANLVDSSQQIATGCAETQGNSFVATGRGGVPQNPTQAVESDRTWNDDRDLSAYRQPGQPTVAQPPAAKPMLLQATTWQRHPDGSAELLADQPTTPLSTVATCSGAGTTTIDADR